MADRSVSHVFSSRRWGVMELSFCRENGNSGIDCCLTEKDHLLIVHLQGRMRRLETELNGRGSSFGPALASEVWSIPAGFRYASHIKSDTIEYAVLRIATTAMPECQVVAAAQDQGLHRLVNQMKALLECNDDTSFMAGEALAEQLHRHLLGNYGRMETPGQTSRGPRLSNGQTKRLREFIYENLGEALTLKELADFAAMTPHQFLAAFRQAFGLSPWQYVIQQRVREAQRQLVHGARDITGIALCCGFSSHSHMTTVFRQRLGFSPRSMRTGHVSAPVPIAS